MPRKTPLFGFNLFYHNESVLSFEDIAPNAIYNGAVQPDASSSLNYNFKRMDFVLQSILSGTTAFTSLRTTQDVIAGRDVVVGRDLRVKGSILLPRDNRPTPHVVFDFGDALINSGLGTNGTVTLTRGGVSDTTPERLKPFSSNNEGALFAGTNAYDAVLRVTKPQGFFDTGLDAYFRLFLAFDKVPQNLSQIILDVSYDEGVTYPVQFNFAGVENVGNASFLSEPLELSSVQRPSSVRLTLQGTGSPAVNFSLRRFALLSGATPALDGFYLPKGGGTVHGGLVIEGASSVGALSVTGALSVSGALTATGSLSGFEAAKLVGQPFDNTNYPANQNPNSVTVQSLLDGLRRSINNIIDNTVGVFQSIDTVDLDVSGQALFNGPVRVGGKLNFTAQERAPNITAGVNGTLFYLNQDESSPTAANADLILRDIRYRDVYRDDGPVRFFGAAQGGGGMAAQGIKVKGGLFSDSYTGDAVRRVEIRQSVANDLDGMVIRSSTAANNVAGQLWAGTGGFVIDSRLGNLTGAANIHLQSGGIDRLRYSAFLNDFAFLNGTKLTLGDTLKGVYAGSVRLSGTNTPPTRFPAGFSGINYGSSYAISHPLGSHSFSYSLTSTDANIAVTSASDAYNIYVYFRRISDGVAVSSPGFTFQVFAY